MRRQCCSPMTEKRGHSVPTAREACKHLRLPVIDDAIESLRMLTVLSTLGPHRLDAGRYIVTSRFRCRSFDRRYVVGALSTGRCLPAVAPRVLIMGDEVRTRSLLPDNHFTPLFKSQPLGQPEKAIGHEPQIEPWLTHHTTAALASFRNPIGVVATEEDASAEMEQHEHPSPGGTTPDPRLLW